ncbi:MAG: hypothetical protein EOO90_13255 [Pedobacter sp.]|nr:MAG: hypothetical protein EOO90_13255 [Pedobacter sp.]
MSAGEFKFLELPIVLLLLVIPFGVSLLFSIWAVYDISKLNITRKEKSSLISFVIGYPIYGVITYIFSDRPKLMGRDHRA